MSYYIIWFLHCRYVCTGKAGDYSSDKVYKVKRIIRLDEYIKENMTAVSPSDYPSEIVIMVVRDFNNK